MSNWFLEIPANEPISQGDILFNCPIVIANPTIDSSGEDNVGEITNLIDTADVVVMTQACDLEDCSISNIVVALLRDPTTMTFNTIFKTPADERGHRVDVFKKVHRGEIPNYALIGKSGIDQVNMGYRYVDFFEIFILPHKFLMDFREYHGPRLRLNTPHRELLSQRFGSFFARIGLPNEDAIQRDKVVDELFPKPPKK